MQPNMMRCTISLGGSSCGISETTSERRSDSDLYPHQVKSRIQIRMRKKLESDPRQSDQDPWKCMEVPVPKWSEQKYICLLRFFSYFAVLSNILQITWRRVRLFDICQDQFQLLIWVYNFFSKIQAISLLTSQTYQICSNTLVVLFPIKMFWWEVPYFQLKVFYIYFDKRWYQTQIGPYW
jgi:hypothetical protein